MDRAFLSDGGHHRLEHCVSRLAFERHLEHRGEVSAVDLLGHILRQRGSAARLDEMPRVNGIAVRTALDLLDQRPFVRIERRT